MAILRRTEKAMCGVKMMEKKSSQELMSLLGLNDTLGELARASGVRWYGRWILKWREEGVGDRK